MTAADSPDHQHRWQQLQMGNLDAPEPPGHQRFTFFCTNCLALTTRVLSVSGGRLAWAGESAATPSAEPPPVSEEASAARREPGSKGRDRVFYYCSFCTKDQDQVQRLVAGPGAVYVCDECVARLADLLRKDRGIPQTQVTRGKCSFCGRLWKQVDRLFEGPNAVTICNECVALCGGIIADESAS